LVAVIESRQPGDPPPKINLVAPIAGLVTKVEARLGDPVEPDSALMEICNLEEVFAIARVPEHQAGRLKPGAVAHIRVAALPGEKLDGELQRFGVGADRESGTIDAIFRVSNESGLLRQDMRAEFSIVMNRRSGVLSVPRAAVQGDASNRFVYVRDFDLPNAFLRTPVEVGAMNDRQAEILGGLFPADEVVIRGAYGLSFAGTGGISLKEALDAAHGHEHAADGSELTDENAGDKPGHDHEEPGQEHEHEDGVSPFWMYAAVAFAILFVLTAFVKRIPHNVTEKETPP
jgi:hypothetical protein